MTTPLSGTNLTLEAGAVWTTRVTVGERLYLNEIEIIKLETTAPEYQYHLMDHLGNVRLTFTTKEDVETNKATMEEANWDTEDKQFHRYDEVRTVRSALFDHTNDTNPTSTDGLAIRLSGNEREKTGLVKTLSVMPGDVVHMKVYAKYVAGSSSSWSAAVNNLITAIAGASSGTVVDGSNYLTRGATPFPYTGLNGTSTSDGLGPKAYLNYIMFDREYTPIIEDPSQTGFARVTEAAREDGKTNLADLANGRPHELLEATVNVKQAGYLYIYLSNEESSPVEVFFDDFEVVHTKGPVVQSEEYYPFGLTFNGYQRENGVQNRWKFQGQEHIDDLSLNWDSFKWRNHQPDIGRFFNVDKLSEKYYYNSPYAFSENKVIAHRELEGLESSSINPGPGNEDARLPNTAGISNLVRVSKALAGAADKAADETVKLTDLNDINVLATMITKGGEAVNTDGSSATTGDKFMAAAGLALPMISGSAVKKLAGPFLVRFGNQAETAEALAEQAAKAEANGFPHGVSTKQVDELQKTDLNHKVAGKSEVEKAFEVKQTGNNPKHHTVILPKPVTPEVANLFNETFVAPLLRK